MGEGVEGCTEGGYCAEWDGHCGLLWFLWVFSRWVVVWSVLWMKKSLHKGLVSCHLQLKVTPAFGDCVPDGLRSGTLPGSFFTALLWRAWVCKPTYFVDDINGCSECASAARPLSNGRSLAEKWIIVEERRFAETRAVRAVRCLSSMQTCQYSDGRNLATCDDSTFYNTRELKARP